jgi:Tol biopolymer transport system component
MADGRAILVNAITYGATGYNIGVGLIDLETNTARILIETGGNARYVPTGHLLFSRGTTLLAAPFDRQRLEVTGEPVALTGDLRTASAWAHGRFEVTDRGYLVFPPGGLIGAGRRISMLDRSGQASPWSETRRAFELGPGAFDVSADGRRVAVVTTNAKGIFEIWTSDTQRPDLRRTVTLTAADASTPTWSPNGERLAFSRMARNEEDGIYWQPADGRGSPTQFLRTEQPLVMVHYPLSWSPDNSTLLAGKIEQGKFEILSLDGVADGPVDAVPLVSGDYNAFVAQFSPDGRWVAFSSDEAGPTEIYLAPYQRDGTLGRRTRVSKGDGQRPIWSPDGRKLYYVANQKHLTSVAITTTPQLKLADPERLLDLSKAGLASPVWGFDLLPDGRILFIEKGEGEDDRGRFNIVLNWTDELQRRVPSGTP